MSVCLSLFSFPWGFFLSLYKRGGEMVFFEFSVVQIELENNRTLGANKGLHWMSLSFPII